MKILHVVPTLGYGGVAKVVTNYYEQMNHSDFIFDFITHGKVEDYHHKLIDDGSKIYYFKTVGSVGIKGYKKQIEDNIVLFEYSVIHLHVGHLTGLYAMLFRQLGAKKIICHAHTTRCVNSKQAGWMFVWRYLAKRYSDYRLACGEEAGRFCFGKGNYTVLPNGISYEKMDSIGLDAIDKLKEEFKIQHDKRIIGHVSAFSPPKNPIFLSNIIHDTLKVDRNIVFVLVGDGELKNHVAEIIKENGDDKSVIFTGIRSDVYTFMKMFDVFLLPSLHEGLPVVGIEAQAAGTICLFSDRIDRTVDIGAGIAYFLSINSGTDEWVTKLNGLTRMQKNETKSKVKKCLEDAGYDIKKNAELLISIYKSL